MLSDAMLDTEDIPNSVPHLFLANFLNTGLEAAGEDGDYGGHQRLVESALNSPPATLASDAAAGAAVLGGVAVAPAPWILGTEPRSGASRPPVVMSSPTLATRQS